MIFASLSFRNHLNVDKWDPLEYKTKLLGSKAIRWTEGRWLWSCKALHPHFVRLTRIPVRRRRWLQGRLTTSILIVPLHTKDRHGKFYNCHICVCKIAAKGSEFVATKFLQQTSQTSQASPWFRVQIRTFGMSLQCVGRLRDELFESHGCLGPLAAAGGTNWMPQFRPTTKGKWWVSGGSWGTLFSTIMVVNNG